MWISVGKVGLSFWNWNNFILILRRREADNCPSSPHPDSFYIISACRKTLFPENCAKEGGICGIFSTLFIPLYPVAVNNGEIGDSLGVAGRAPPNLWGYLPWLAVSHGVLLEWGGQRAETNKSRNRETAAQRQERCKKGVKASIIR